MDDPKQKLVDAMNEGYANLSKWLIALATGTVIFSVKLVNSALGNFWRYELLLGLVLLMISIIFGVRCVRLRLDGLHFDYLGLKLRNSNNHSEENRATLEWANKRFGEVNKEVLFYLTWQERVFYLGLIMVTIFGIYSIK